MYYGSNEPLPPRHVLRAGPLGLIYENGGLRYITLGDREVIRGIYCAVRDQNWGTVPSRIHDERIEACDDSFQIEYGVEHVEGDIDFAWQGSICGSTDGTIEIVMDGVARSTFLRNRIGFCILHPMRECAGARCKATHENGSTSIGSFPRFIAPDAPLVDLVAIEHEVAEGVWARLEFSGDVFEMEDQRNWTDASFKTFCTPLRLPFPVEIQKGTTIRQSVRLSLKGPAVGSARRAGPTRRPDSGKNPPIVIEVSTDVLAPVPKIGVQTASHAAPHSPNEVKRLAALNLAHLRTEIRFAPGWEEVVQRVTREAGELKAALELAIFLTDDAERELRALASVLPNSQASVARLLIFHVDDLSTSRQWVELTRRVLCDDHGLSAPVGSGTNANFMELNSGRPPVDVIDFVCYSLQPQEHAFDNASLAETLAAQQATVESARQFAGGRPIVVSPVTFKKRVNPYAKGPEPATHPDQLPPQVDPRQATLFGAGWTLGSLKYLGESGIESVTYYETTGWRGVMETESGCPLPGQFPSRPGCVFPLYHVLADVGDFVGGEVLGTRASQPLVADAVAIRRDGASRCLVANFIGDRQTVEVHGLTGSVSVRVLDETCFSEAIESPEDYRQRKGAATSISDRRLTLDLLPYAVARIDAG
jgi:hypothetical protein